MIPFLDLRSQLENLRQDYDAAYAAVMDRGRFILDEEVTKFEQAFAEYCGSKHCIGVGSGYDALLLILKAMDIGPSDEVLVPAHTFFATWQAVSATGATPIGVDVDPGTFNMDPVQAARKITERTKAMMPVHLYGLLAAMEPLKALCKQHGLKLIEDAAQAQGSPGAGALSDAAAFSFYPVKNLGAFGDAGCVTTSNDALAARIRRLGNYGSEQKYVHLELGVNSRLDELQAAFLKVSLKQLDAWNGRRREVAAVYDQRLSEQFQLPIQDPSCVWHQYVIRHPKRDQLADFLKNEGVGTMIHYPLPPFQQMPYRDTDQNFPVAKSICETCLSLPMHPFLSDDHLATVIDTVNRFPG